ncbi:hypothetical protein [Flavobacterium sp. UBA4197]|uniref:hypothetical protein n=1 Tax=Flavobacterium sp. UBA4197 TaxID=1946546 RepID=UPI0025801D92|nr:hypothetical protein [Flavobacterium sp. UBA4197]
MKESLDENFRNINQKLIPFCDEAQQIIDEFKQKIKALQERAEIANKGSLWINIYGPVHLFNNTDYKRDSFIYDDKIEMYRFNIDEIVIQPIIAYH